MMVWRQETRYVLVIFLLSTMKLTVSGLSECYSCTYTRLDSNPSIGYNCVTNPPSIYVMPCSSPNICKARANFDPVTRVIVSLARGCLNDGKVCDGERCCNNYGGFLVCEQKCSTDLCNDINAETLDNMTTPSPITTSEATFSRRHVTIPGHLFFVSNGSAAAFNVYIHSTLAVLCLFICLL